MIVILGESASGKSTLQKMFIENHPEYKKVITYTTRPKRKGEVDSVDYHFVTEKKFKKLIDEGFFAEYTEYRKWSYGTARKDCEADNTVAVLNPPGFRSLKRLGIDTKSVYLYVDRRSRLINILLRGDDVDESYRRNLSDEGQFSGIVDEVDHVIDNANFHMDELQTLKCLESIVEEVTNESV